MNYWVRLASVAALGTVLAGAAGATLINVQFSGVAQQTGAAVVGSAGDVWNQFSGSSAALTNVSGNGLALNTSAGVASGLTLSYSAPSTYIAPLSTAYFTNTPYANLMRGYLVGKPTTGSISITIGGLGAGAAYSLYVYTQGDSYSNGRKNNVTVNGITKIDSISSSTANVFTAGANYSLFEGFADANGRILIANASSTQEVDLNGLQLVTALPQSPAGVPETGTWAMMAGGFGILGGALRRRKGSRRFA